MDNLQNSMLDIIKTWFIDNHDYIEIAELTNSCKFKINNLSSVSIFYSIFDDDAVNFAVYHNGICTGVFKIDSFEEPDTFDHIKNKLDRLMSIECRLS